MVKSTTNQLTSAEKDYLNKIYTDLSKQGSFAGINSILRAIKKSGKFNINQSKLKQWLESNETYTLHKPLKRNFQRNRVVVGGINIEWDLDLADLALLSQYNNGYSYFLVVIDDFTKYVYTKALETKTGKEVAQALKEILKSANKTPQIFRCDQGNEFSNRFVKSLLKEKGIRLWITQNEKKANIAERCIKTLKNKIYKYFTLNQTLNWIDILPIITDTYNKSYHRSIGMSPIEVTEENEDQVWQKLYPIKALKDVQDFKFDINDKVRISVLRKAFEREYDIKWTVEYFIVADRFYKDEIPKYKLKDYNNEEIMGTFYEEELQKIEVTDETSFKIEKIIKRKTVRGNRQVLVKWWGWPDRFNSWIPQTELRNYRNN